MTLEDSLKENRGIGPGFHMIRHALALSILTFHCYYAVIGTHASNPYAHTAVNAASMGKMTYFQLARELFRPTIFALVASFFALSGFLVTGSALRTGKMSNFFANRALRIFPALSVEVTLSAFILGPIVTNVALRHYFVSPVFFRYFGNIVGHITYYLPGVFTTNPWPNTVNATLWTLPSEFWCYAIMLFMMAVGILARKNFTTICIIFSLVLILILNVYDPVRFNIRNDVTHFTTWYIVMMFMFGALIFINAKYIPLNWMLFIGSAIAYYAVLILRFAEPLSGIFLTYCTIYIGMKPFKIIDKLIPVDISYGTYLYGFPITQFLVFELLPKLGHRPPLFLFAVILLLAISITAIFASLSWHYIEKPMLSLRRHLIREPRPA